MGRSQQVNEFQCGTMSSREVSSVFNIPESSASGIKKCQAFLSQHQCLTSQMFFLRNGHSPKLCGILPRRAEAVIAASNGPTSFQTLWIKNRISLKFICV
ncbi:hypothetical protein AMECASPLE_023296 [Ameca splendens]|uniref:Uncharacterized protein n=1 Tax=Ameca splendens TaxID=208324 RepID=A0ABV0XSX8_9TELE